MHVPGKHSRQAWSRIACAGLLALLAACSRPAPEEALRATIAEMQAAVEARDASALQDRLAEDFIGPESMDRDGARRLAQVVFLRNRRIGATLGPLDVTMQGETATVRFTAGLTGGSGPLLPESAQVYDVTTGWRMRGGAWELVSVDWEPRI